MANGGHAQVNAVGTSKHHCKEVSWAPSGADLVVNVRCYTQAGILGDTKFNVLFLLPSQRLAYAWADRPTLGSYAPALNWRSNPVGGPINSVRLTPGTYNVSWTGINPVILGGGSVQVTAYGAGSAQCKVSQWGAANAIVRCFAPNGAPIDSRFTVLMGS